MPKFSTVKEDGVSALGSGDVWYASSIFKDATNINTINRELVFVHLQEVNSGGIQPLVVVSLITEIQHGPVGVHLV